jgi:hypothetical protein
MRKIVISSYKEFLDFLNAYIKRSRDTRHSIIFRGHSDADWSLQTTLDRERGFKTDAERSTYYAGLIQEFRREAIKVIANPLDLPDGEPLALLARHHGVPSPYLDWTGSPYIAAFFAFEYCGALKKKPAAIWIFNRAQFKPLGNEIELLDDPELIRFNRRALQQRGLFMKIDTIRLPVEELLGDALTKVIVPATLRTMVMASLDEMSINAASLFADLDGAARTARYRMSS